MQKKFEEQQAKALEELKGINKSMMGILENYGDLKYYYAEFKNELKVKPGDKKKKKKY